MKTGLLWAPFMMAASLQMTQAAEQPLLAEIDRMAAEGKTLDAEIAAQFPLAEQAVVNDTGINVLVDLAHGCNFFQMWRMPKPLRQGGMRSVGSQAALHSVLAPGSQCRARVPVGDRMPFAWIPAPRFNVVLTNQGSPAHQPYLPEEIEALEAFVNQGGGLVVVAGSVSDEEEIRQWSLNDLIGKFGASLSPEKDAEEGVKASSTLSVGEEWEPVRKGAKGRVLCARRVQGKGRVVVISSRDIISYHNKKSPKEEIEAKEAFIVETMKWAAGGAAPVGGTLRLPTERGGGGPIYPEMETRVGNVVVYYARNQLDIVLKTVREEMPLVKEQIEAWLPSIERADPMYIVLSSGGGGGWAVNAYLPKEVGTISPKREGILSVFAHELAHTMGGPPNEKGETAGRAPHGNQGEAHAGWFQTKIIKQVTGETPASRHGNYMFTFDKEGNALDLAMDRAEFTEKWGKGKDWKKTWWLWQKLDDRYGPTWYPRWRWIQHTRWQDDPEHALTWDEMVEEMSIAVGEDLFPFFRKIGTTLDKDRLERITFQGKEIELPVAPLEIGPVGDPILDAIADYTKPLTPADRK
jgi:hypothetical protein